MKKYLLTFILSAVGLSFASAEEPVQGIIVSYEGSETSYKLEDMPTVKCETIEGVQYAVLYLKDNPDPVLSVVLAEGKKLTVAYGEYASTGIGGVKSDKVTITERNGKKFFNGGKIIVIARDGKMYNAAGVEIKK